MSAPVYISDIMREIVTKVSLKLTPLFPGDYGITGVYFEYGHYTDIRERLMAKSKVQEEKANRFPLVCLFEDFRIRKGKPGLTGISDLKMIILHSSSNKITREQREQNVFRPILYPIYLELLAQLKASGYFMIYSEVKHDMIARPHWGDPAMYGNDSYLFNDILDGIELNNLELQTYLNNCLAA